MAWVARWRGEMVSAGWWFDGEGCSALHQSYSLKQEVQRDAA
jgi:hypothetical protein